MTPDLFARCGKALYGPQWKQQLAYDLGINTRTVQRWAAGSHVIPLSAVEALRLLLDERAAAIRGLLQESLARRAPAAAMIPPP